MVDYKFYPKSGPFVLIMPGITYDNNYIPDGTLTDQNVTLRYSKNFRNTAMLTASLTDVFQKLPADFDVLDPEGDSILLKGEEYDWNEFEVKYTSNTRKLFTYMITVRAGEFYNGNRTGIAGTLSYRIQPYGSISLTGDYNDIILPPEYGSAKFCRTICPAGVDVSELILQRRAENPNQGSRWLFALQAKLPIFEAILTLSAKTQSWWDRPVPRAILERLAAPVMKRIATTAKNFRRT